MDLDAVLREYDAMFGVRAPREILAYLEARLDEAGAAGDSAARIVLLNETIGFCRDASFVPEGLDYARQLEECISAPQWGERIEYATTMLNLGNAYRGYGEYARSLERYADCEAGFARLLEPGDFLYAGLYNNKGLLYQERQEWEEAVASFTKALAIVDRYPEHRIEQATTRANLAAALLELTPERIEEAERRLGEAVAIFEEDGGRDFHYSAALSALGTVKFRRGEYRGAAADFQKAMEMLYAGTGESEAYRRVRESYETALRYAEEAGASEAGAVASGTSDAVAVAAGTSDAGAVASGTFGDTARGSETARLFYERALLPRLKEQCAAALDVIAIGYAGEGSEHFGYDDPYSTDHDYARGATIWLLELYAPTYGAALQRIYIQAYEAYFGTAPELAAGRQGVRLLEDYFERLTGIGEIATRLATDGLGETLYLLDELQLAGIAAAVNGEVYYDGEGTMTRLREFFLHGMPEEYRRRKLATLTHLYSQAGQYDYARSMRRGDYATALLYKARAMETALQFASYLNRRFPPYVKWLRRFVSEQPRLAEIADICAALADLPDGRERFREGGIDDTALSFDIIATLLLEEMRSQGLIAEYRREEPFMDPYIGEIAGLRSAALSAGAEDAAGAASEKKEAAEMNREELIEAVIREEWAQFDKTINEGGRADCQDNWETFSVMRRSQYLTWEEEMLASFYHDLTQARAEGRNLITEKYGRMMESTAPERYAELAVYFPERTPERRQIQEEIIRVQIAWMEAFAEQYPKLAGNARTIHTSEDTAENTSYETYLRGELGTYSEETLLLYGRFIARLAQEGKNLAYETMNNTARLLGYADAADAESKL